MTFEKLAKKCIGVAFILAFTVLAAGCATSGRDVPDAPDVVAIQQTARSGELSRLQHHLDDNPALANAARNEDHKTPLYWAARNGHSDIVEILIRNGANVNAKASRRSALMAARQEGRSEIYELLEKHGAKE